MTVKMINSMYKYSGVNVQRLIKYLLICLDLKIINDTSEPIT